jgi:hypothetical protein
MSTRSNSIAGPGRSSWRRRLGTIAASAAMIGAFIVASPQTAPAEAATANSAYVMAYFRESPNGSGNSNNVHLAVSKDALEWTALNDNAPILVPTLGTKGIRDPFLFRLQDGSWVMTATDLKNENFGAANPSIHIWTSPDLVNWSSDRLLNINSANPNSFTWHLRSSGTRHERSTASRSARVLRAAPSARSSSSTHPTSSRRRRP